MYKASVKHKMVLSAGGTPGGWDGSNHCVCVCVQVLFSSQNDWSDLKVQCVKFSWN